MNRKAFPIFLAFLCMGFADAVGPFTSLAKQQFSLTDFEAGLIAFMGFIMFGVLSIPMGLVQDRIGKKKVLLIGLVLMACGLGIPLVGGFEKYTVFLVTILMLGAGGAILQVAGNPIMRDVSPEGKYARNLSLGQFVKAIGSLSASLIPIVAAAWFGADWKVCFPIYVGALVVSVLIITATPITEQKDPNSKPATLGSCLALLGNPMVLTMVLAIFFYVGAEVAISSKLATYLSDRFKVDLSTWGLFGNMFFFIFILTGRFLGSVILSFMSPGRFLLVTCVLSLIGIAGLWTTDQYVAYAAIGAIGLGFANIFPLVFSICIDRKPERANEISGLMVTAIVGGAFIPPIMGLVADKTGSLLTGLIVPAACIVYILLLSLAHQGAAKKA
jgi:fucose permease